MKHPERGLSGHPTRVYPNETDCNKPRATRPLFLRVRRGRKKVSGGQCIIQDVTQAESTDPEGVPVPLVPISGTLPAWLADLSSIAADLETAARFLERHMTLAAHRAPEGGEPLDTDLQALWNASVISYRRAWTSGRSLILPKESRPKLADSIIKHLSEDEQATHQKVWEQASKHVAHRVADLEQAQVYVALAPEGVERGIVGTARLIARFIGPDLADAENALALYKTVHSIVERELNDLTTGSASALSEDVDIDTLYGAWAEIQQRPPFAV